MAKCPCNSGKSYNECCSPLIEGKRDAATPEELMRSRYTAFVQVNIDYIEETMQGAALKIFNKQATMDWAEKVEWLGLTIIDASQLAPDAKIGLVEFVAKYKVQNKQQCMHEISKFCKKDNRWFYVDGKQIKIGRNDPCPCGSGKKYKKCCGQ
jgi:SEC-C motif-containing protein